MSSTNIFSRAIKKVLASPVKEWLFFYIFSLIIFGLTRGILLLNEILRGNCLHPRRAGVAGK